MKTNINNWLRVLLAVGVLLPPLAAPARADEASNARFHEALMTETVSRDVEKAVELYNKITQESKNDILLVAKAQLRLGICYEKMGKTEEALAAYNQALTLSADSLIDTNRIAQENINRLAARVDHDKEKAARETAAQNQAAAPAFEKPPKNKFRIGLEAGYMRERLDIDQMPTSDFSIESVYFDDQGNTIGSSAYSEKNDYLQPPLSSSRRLWNDINVGFQENAMSFSIDLTPQVAVGFTGGVYRPVIGLTEIQTFPGSVSVDNMEFRRPNPGAALAGAELSWKVAEAPFRLVLGGDYKKRFKSRFTEKTYDDYVFSSNNRFTGSSQTTVDIEGWTAAAKATLSWPIGRRVEPFFDLSYVASKTELVRTHSSWGEDITPNLAPFSTNKTVTNVKDVLRVRFKNKDKFRGAVGFFVPLEKGGGSNGSGLRAQAGVFGEESYRLSGVFAF
jgi:tetratricopeptide (TPR) repeat protein